MVIPVPNAAPPDYRLAFQLAPVGLILSLQRRIMDCNERVCEMFGATPADLIGQSFRILYPSADEYERTGARITPILNTHGLYADNRVMKRVGGPRRGETFWCHVTGRAIDREAPHAAGIWTFEDLSAHRPRNRSHHPGRGRLRRQHFRGQQAAGHQPPHGGDLPRAADAQVPLGHDGGAGAAADGRVVNQAGGAPSTTSAALRNASTAQGTPQ